jgi:plasmid stabilization system protein ParE
MAYQIIWTAEADKDFYSIIHYLKENWSDYSAQKFAERDNEKVRTDCPDAL